LKSCKQQILHSEWLSPSKGLNGVVPGSNTATWGVNSSSSVAEQRLSSGEAQLALAALNALAGPGAQSAVQSLAAVRETHGLGREVQVLQTWLSRH
jgi:hypothetical protein